MSTMHRAPIGTANMHAGQHLLLECFGRHAHLDQDSLEALMRKAAAAGGATVLDCHLHTFGPNQGVTGVALLAESHITVHTWPESDYAAFDIFMCGNCDPRRAAAVIEDAFDDARVDIRTFFRPGHAVESPVSHVALNR